ncbi:hypothetical protein H1R20_g8840, partial [Candolleomyces eurysporus]
MSVGLSLRWLLPWSSSSSSSTELGELGRGKTKRRSGSMSSPSSPGKERKKIRKGVRTRAEQVKALNGSAKSHEDSLKLGEDDGYFPGLVNISGTYCFMNSTLQALASLSYLQPHIDAIHAKAEALDVPTPVVDALKDLFRELNTPRSSYHSLRPLAIIEVLSSQTQGRTNSLFYSREHQDAQELFQVVSECIKNEIAAVDKEGARDRGFGALAAGPLPPEATIDIGKSVFDGLTANRRSCVICGYTEAVMHFAFDNWQLTVPRLAAACRLEDCLEDYTRLEILKDCICRKCSMVATHIRLKRDIATLTAEVNKPDAKPSASKKKRLKEVKKMEARVQAALDEGRIEDDLKDVRMEKVFSSASTKQAMIARPPPVLALHLNRSIHYGHYASKNNCRVVFPEVLDLTAYTTSGNLSTIPTAAISTPPPPSSRKPKSRSTTPTPSLYHGEDGRGQRTIYRLSAVVCHFGSHSFGHYISYRRKPRPLSDDDDGKDGESVWGLENPKLVDPLYAASLSATSLPNQVGDELSAPDSTGEDGKRADTAIDGAAEEEEDLEPQYTFADTPSYSRPGTGWLRISDDSVRECGIETVLAEGSSSVFMLYYELAVHDRRGVYQSQAAGASSMSGANGIAGEVAVFGFFVFAVAGFVISNVARPFIVLVDVAGSESTFLVNTHWQIDVNEGERKGELDYGQRPVEESYRQYDDGLWVGFVAGVWCEDREECECWAGEEFECPTTIIVLNFWVTSAFHDCFESREHERDCYSRRRRILVQGREIKEEEREDVGGSGFACIFAPTVVINELHSNVEFFADEE